MSVEKDTTNALDPPFRALVELWGRYVHQANVTTQRLLDELGSTVEPHDWRRRWFHTLGSHTDDLLRSPQFLQVMRVQIESLISALQNDGPVPDNGGHASAQQSGDRQRLVHLRLEQLKQRAESIAQEAGCPGNVRLWEQFLNARHLPPEAPDGGRGTTPHEVVYAAGRLKVLRYENPALRYAEPVLICYALVNRPYILDLQADRSVVRRLLDAGFDVYLIDWGIPSDADRDLQLQDYVCRFLRDAADVVCEHAGSPNLNLLGYCMGGTMAAMFTALFLQRVRNLILLAAPVDFSTEAGLLNLWAQKQYFDVDRLIDTCGNCPGEFLQFCFQLMKPVQNFAEKYVTFCENLDDNAFLENFLAIERWAHDSIPVAGATFREFVKWLYQENRLVNGELSLGGAGVRLDRITCPLLLLVAEQDHLVPPSSTLAVKQHVRSPDVAAMSIDAGHIGLAVSSKAHAQLWPRAAAWIAEHSTEKPEHPIQH